MENLLAAELYEGRHQRLFESTQGIFIAHLLYICSILLSQQAHFKFDRYVLPFPFTLYRVDRKHSCIEVFVLVDGFFQKISF